MASLEETQAFNEAWIFGIDAYGINSGDLGQRMETVQK